MVAVLELPRPIEVVEQPPQWKAFAADGLNTAFCFPFRPDLDAHRRDTIANRLMSLPLTTVLFLKHLESIEVRVERVGSVDSQSWTVSRELSTPNGWAPTTGLGESGSYRIRVNGSAGGKAGIPAWLDRALPKVTIESPHGGGGRPTAPAERPAEAGGTP